MSFFAAQWASLDDPALDGAALKTWREESHGETTRPSDDRMACAVEAVRDWMGWIFEAGPQPHHVMKRLVVCTATGFGLGPVLTPRLTPGERAAVSVVGGEKECLRLLGVRPADVHAALSRAYRREGRTWDPLAEPSALEAMTIREDRFDSEESLTRSYAVEMWLRRLWEAGASFSGALKHLLADVRAIAPELLLNMSGEEIAALFGQGRAAESARVKHRVNDFLARAGYRKTQLRFQKSVGACATYARAQRGNQNRIKGLRSPVAA